VRALTEQNGAQPTGEIVVAPVEKGTDHE
jgi:hypothetical protein